jgi:hypothetical protein
MKRTTFTVVDEPRGDAFQRLCHFAEQAALNILLVVRDRPPLRPEALELLARLEPSVVSRNITAEWPGTRLLGHTATMFVLCPDAKGWASIRDAADGLFDWRHPALPEDLCLLRRDGSTFLGNVAHEADAFMELDDIEKDAVLKAVPTLRLR